MLLLDQTDKRPIYEQIIEKLSDLMIRGILKEDTPLPSVRNLAAELSINPNTVQRAYVELERLGYIYSKKGKGSFVASQHEISVLKNRLLSEELQKLLEKVRDTGVSENTCLELVRKVYQQKENDSKNEKGGGL